MSVFQIDLSTANLFYLSQDEVALSHKKMRFHIPEPPVDVITHRTVKVGDLPDEKVIAVGAKSGAPPGPEGTRQVIRTGDKATDDLYVSKFKSHFHRK